MNKGPQIRPGTGTDVSIVSKAEASLVLLDDLNNTLDELEKKLVPVLNPNPMLKAENDNISKQSSAIGNLLQLSIDKINDSISRINRIISELDL